MSKDKKKLRLKGLVDLSEPARYQESMEHPLALLKEEENEEIPESIEKDKTQRV